METCIRPIAQRFNWPDAVTVQTCLNCYDDITELCHREPWMHLRNLMLNQGHSGVSASNTEQTDLEETEKQIQINHCTVSFLRFSCSTMLPAPISPQMDVRVYITSTKTLEEKLLRNELDIALTEGLVHNEELVTEAYLEDSLTAWVWQYCPDV